MSTNKPLVPPHSTEAEESLLGAILLNNEAFDRVADMLDTEHFFHPANGKLYETIRALVGAGKAATATAVKPFLAQDGIDQYLTRITVEATTIVNATHYGRIIKDMAIRRQLIAIAEEMRQKAFEGRVDDEPRQQIEEIERKLYSLTETGKSVTGTFETFDTALTDSIDMAARAYQRDGGLSGLATGLTDLDGNMGGLQNSDLIILAGRPGMGKTALATNIAYNVAAAAERGDGGGGTVGFFSLEMSREQLATRVLAEQSRIPSGNIRRGMIDEIEFDRLRDVAQKIGGIPLYVDQTGGLSVAQLATRARRLKRQRGLDLLVVDYLQLMRGSKRRQNDNRVMEVTEITMALKALAKELNIPILALSQLSRQVESREDKRPQLSDLRESGSIEQDADVVMFVFREEYYLQMRKPAEGDSEYQEWLARCEKCAGKAEIIIGKQRHGPTGNVELHFDPRLTGFSNLSGITYR